jgi:hypothetical protein
MTSLSPFASSALSLALPFPWLTSTTPTLPPVCSRPTYHSSTMTPNAHHSSLSLASNPSPTSPCTLWKESAIRGMHYASWLPGCKNSISRHSSHHPQQHHCDKRHLIHRTSLGGSLPKCNQDMIKRPARRLACHSASVSHHRSNQHFFTSPLSTRNRSSSPSFRTRLARLPKTSWNASSHNTSTHSTFPRLHSPSSLKAHCHACEPPSPQAKSKAPLYQILCSSCAASFTRLPQPTRSIATSYLSS